METFKIKPNGEGKKVRDPITFEPLKPAGEEKPRNEYWLRRVLDGAVVKVEAEVEADTKADTETKTKKVAKEQ